MGGKTQFKAIDKKRRVARIASPSEPLELLNSFHDMAVGELRVCYVAHPPTIHEEPRPWSMRLRLPKIKFARLIGGGRLRRGGIVLCIVATYLRPSHNATQNVGPTSVGLTT